MKKVIKINVNKRYDHKPYYSNAGDGKIRKYSYTHLETGEKVLEYKNSDSLYDLIQSYKDETNIYNIAEKFFSGNLQLLDYNKSFFLDTTKLPKNYVDFKNHYLETENIFRSLPIEFKKLFNNDYGRFAKSLEDDTFSNILLDNADMLNKKFKFNTNDFLGIKVEEKGVIDENTTEIKE